MSERLSESEVMSRIDPAVAQIAQELGIEPTAALAIVVQVAHRHLAACNAKVKPVAWFNRVFNQWLEVFIKNAELPANRVRGKFGRLIGTHLGLEVTADKVKQWSKATQPKTRKMAETVLAAAELVATRAKPGDLSDADALVDGAQVKEALDRVFATGMTRRQVGLAIHQSSYTVGTWARGDLPVPRGKFEAAMQSIAEWQTRLQDGGHLTQVGVEQFTPHYRSAIEQGFTDEDIMDILKVAPFRLRCISGRATAKHPAFITQAQFAKFMHAFFPGMESDRK